MNHTIIPSVEPKASKSVPAPMIYVKENLKWEYKQVIRNLETEDPLGTSELNALGVGGWELAGVISLAPNLYFYFKRTVD